MTYKQKISRLIRQVPTTIVDFDVPRERSRAPSQAFSEFLTNREQGDWAENLVLAAINGLSKNHIAVHYGKSENKAAGEEGFEEFFNEYQDELELIGKRPDILIFPKPSYKPEWNYDISRLPHDQLQRVVPKAIAGIEIRSSSFLIDKYDAEMQRRQTEHTVNALQIKSKILNDFEDLLTPEWKDYLATMTEEKLSIANFRVPSRRSTQRHVELTTLFKELKASLDQIQKRDFLSITPKAEDLKVVNQWIQTYDVPHFYFQVFFDKVYGISFEQILQIISDPANEGQTFFVEEDVKNQNKTTIKINSKSGLEIAYKVDMPTHKSQMKELPRGRLLFYVTFQGGTAYLNVQSLLTTLGIPGDNF